MPTSSARRVVLNVYMGWMHSGKKASHRFFFSSFFFTLFSPLLAQKHHATELDYIYIYVDLVAAETKHVVGCHLKWIINSAVPQIPGRGLLQNCLTLYPYMSY